LVRVDVALVERGLARSRNQASALVESGRVYADGREVNKSSKDIDDETKLIVLEAVDYVSRAGHKLASALDVFAEIDPVGKIALDVGASTGGFTDVLLRRGVAHVVAIDVGHDQMVPDLLENPRVTCIEGFNARDLSTDTLRAQFGKVPEFELVVADLSFISLTLVLDAMVSVAPHADFVLLVKPQFEVGKTSLNAKGIVNDHRLRAQSIMGVMEHASKLGLGVHGVVKSDLPGTHGNIEYILWMSARSKSFPSEWNQRVEDLAREGR
jgi:23S rRNA (cytidine1920-2'-O)/16S rRNA (cytidine1409-2'-O)-methyltransferase